MDAELKAKWVAALRSGEFKQGRGQLRRSEREEYCCLGVLAKVCGMDFDYPTIRETAGFDMTTEELLVDLNDGNRDHDGKPFTEIADFIEANL